MRFDSGDGAADNRLVRRLLRFAAVIFALVGLCASAWATCIEGATSPDAQQMACCKNGHHTCGKDGAPADCCKTDGSKFRDVVTIAKVDPVRMPSPIAMIWALLPDVAVLDSGRRAMVHPSARLIPPLSPPPYIAFSS